MGTAAIADMTAETQRINPDYAIVLTQTGKDDGSYRAWMEAGAIVRDQYSGQRRAGIQPSR